VGTPKLSRIGDKLVWKKVKSSNLINARSPIFVKPGLLGNLGEP